MRTALIHIKPSPIGWQLWVTGISEPYGQFPRKAEARKAAEEFADSHRPARVQIHRLDGSIESELRYEARVRKAAAACRRRRPDCGSAA